MLATLAQFASAEMAAYIAAFRSSFFRVSKQTVRCNRRYISCSSVVNDQYTVQDQADFKAKVLESKKPVVVNFRASWCGPCKMLTPRLEAAVDAIGDKVDLAKVDIDEQADLAMQYEVEAVPSVVMIQNGKVTDRFVGLKDDDQIKSFLAKVVAS
ncbi:thioredoxin, mitochondrial-like [Ornithodoros turicata]